MCGLAGVFGNICNIDQTAFKQLLILASLRGPHSTGVGILKASGKADFCKLAVNPYEFLAYEDAKKNTVSAWMDAGWATNQAVMGHGRWATVGNVVDDNAHPFQHDHITLMHNGGIHNHKFLEGRDKSFEVDSESAAYYLAKKGLQALLSDARGDYAFTWIDTKANTFNLVRNDARPIWIAENKHRNTWYYSSEPEMLKFVLDRAKIDYKPMWQPAPGVHVEFSRATPAELKLTNMEMPKLFSYASQNASDEYRAGGGTRPFRHRHRWEGAYYDRDFFEEDGEAATKPTVKESAKETTASAGTTTEKGTPKVVSIAGTSGASYSRDHRIGQEFIDHNGYKRGGKLHGFFDKCIISSPATASMEYPMRGTLIGTFDDADALQCQIEITCPDVRKLMKNKDEFRSDWLSFTFVSIVWDCVNEVWIAYGHTPMMADFQGSNWTSLAEPTPKALSSWLMKTNLPRGMIAHMSTWTTDDVKGSAIHAAYNGVMLTADKFDEEVKCGCSLCRCDLSHKDSSTIGWVEKDSPLCGECSLKWMSGDASIYTSISQLH